MVISTSLFPALGERLRQMAERSGEPMDASLLDKYKQRLRSRLPLIGGWLQDQALHALAEDGSAEAVRVLAAVVLDGVDDCQRTRALEALRRLAASGQVAAQEALCRLVVHNDHALARNVVLAAGYAPHEEIQRALFYFLTGQWAAYDALDFDHQLLRQAFQNASGPERARIAAAARQAGRLEWVDLVAGGKKGRRLATMTDAEWAAAQDMLEAGRRWEDLWHLVLEAPPRWSARILRRQTELHWSIQDEDRAGFHELARLASAWNEEDLTPFFFHRATLEGHQNAVRCLAMTHSGNILLSGSVDKTVRLWSLPEGNLLKTLQGHEGWIDTLILTQDDRLVASAGRDGRILLWRLPSGRFVKALDGHEGTVFCLAATADGKVLASGSADQNVRLWMLSGGEEGKVCEGHTAPVTCLAASPQGDILASGSADCTVRLWSLPEGRALRTLDGHRAEREDGILSLAISPDGKILASAGTDSTVQLWALPGGRALKTLRMHTGNVSALATTVDGNLLVTVGGDYTVQLWRLPEGDLIKTLDGHVNEGGCLAMSADGRLLATSSGGGWGLDHTVRVWDLTRQRATQFLSGHTRHVSSLAMSPDGGLLVSASGDGCIRLWSAEVERLSRLPAGLSRLEDLQWVHSALESDSLPDSQRAALAFIAALLRWRRRSDIVIEEAAPRVLEVGEFDIEIEG